MKTIDQKKKIKRGSEKAVFKLSLKEGNEIRKEIDADVSMFDFVFGKNSAVRESADSLEAKTAIEYYGMKTTFAALEESVRRCAGALRRIGVQKGDKIIISLITTPESVSLLYACSLMGVCAVMADVRYSKDEILQLCANISPKAVFLSDWQGRFTASVHKHFPNTALIVVSPVALMPFFVRFGRSFYQVFTANRIYRFVRGEVMGWRDFISGGIESFDEDAPADGSNEILFATSGTTGERKYVVLSDMQLNIASYQLLMSGIDERKVTNVLSIMPIFTCYGFVTSVHLPLCVGKKICVCPIYDADKVPEMMLKYKPEVFSGTPFQFDAMLASKKMKNADLSFIKYLFSGGEKIDSEKQIGFNSFLRDHGSDAILAQGYGMTELCSVAVLQDANDFVPGSAGKMLYSTKVKIIDRDTQKELPRGEEGEVCIHTPCATRGYFGNEKGTSELLHLHDDGLFWVHSGDLGYLDNDGNLFISGRIKRMIVSDNGTKMFLQLIEDTVNADERISESAAITVTNKNKKSKNKKSGEDNKFKFRIILFCVAAEKELPKAEIYRMIRTSLPDYMKPDEIVFSRALPKTSSGKIDYRALENTYGD